MGSVDGHDTSRAATLDGQVKDLHAIIITALPHTWT